MRRKRDYILHILSTFKARHLWKYMAATYALRSVYWYNSIPWYTDTVLPMLMTLFYFMVNLISETNVAIGIAWSFILMILLFKLPLKRIVYTGFRMYFCPIKPIQIYFDADYIYNQLWTPAMEVLVVAAARVAGRQYGLETRLCGLLEFISWGVLFVTVAYSVFEFVDYICSFRARVDGTSPLPVYDRGEKVGYYTPKMTRSGAIYGYY